MNRIQKIKNAVSSRGLDAIIIKNPHNRFYATGFRSSAGCVIVTAREAFFFTDSRYIENAEALVKEMTVGLVCAEMRESQWIYEAVRDCGIKNLGFEEEYLSHSAFTKLGGSLEGVSLIPAQELLKNLRSSKDPQELEAIREAQSITEAVFTEVLGLISPGMTEREIAAELVYRMLRAGAQGTAFDPIVLSGKKSSMPHGEPGGEKLTNGGFLIMDFGCVVRGYCSDMTRTVALGRATSEMREVYDIVLKAQIAGISAAKAGIPGRDIDAAARRVIENRGFGEAFGHGFGHSLGLEIHEAPNASPSEADIMPKGAVISAEPGIYLPGRFGVRIEDILYLNDNGCENLTRAPKELLVI